MSTQMITSGQVITTGNTVDPGTVEDLTTVTVRDRSREASWGVGLTTPVIRKVHISAFCPNCGPLRGERSWLTTHDDGQRYWTETWSCLAACGHVDHHANVWSKPSASPPHQRAHLPPRPLPL